MIRGTESKGVIFNKLKEIYPNSFWEDEGKILRVPMNEGGTPKFIQILFGRMRVKSCGCR